VATPKTVQDLWTEKQKANTRPVGGPPPPPTVPAHRAKILELI